MRSGLLVFFQREPSLATVDVFMLVAHDGYKLLVDNPAKLDLCQTRNAVQSIIRPQFLSLVSEVTRLAELVASSMRPSYKRLRTCSIWEERSSSEAYSPRHLFATIFKLPSIFVPGLRASSELRRADNKLALCLKALDDVTCSQNSSLNTLAT